MTLVYYMELLWKTLFFFISTNLHLSGTMYSWIFGFIILMI